MRRAGPWTLAGVLLLSATACSDDDDATAATSTPSATTAPNPSTQPPTTPSTSTPPAPTTPPTTPASTTAPVITPAVTPATAPPRASFPDDISAIAGIAATTFQYPGSPLTPDEALCISDALVHVFGRSRVEELGFGNSRWTLVGFALALGPWDRADSEAVVDIFRVCTPDWELLAIMSSTEGASAISVESGRCVADALPDDEARELFVNGLDRPPGLPVDELRERAEDLYRSCLTPEEFAGLDFG